MMKILQEAVGERYRYMLRATLLESRGVFNQPGYCEVECATCWRLMPAGQAVMHESLLTRGNVSGDKENKYLVFHPCNAVFRHDVCLPVFIEPNLVEDPEPSTLIQPKPYIFRHEGGTGGDMTFKRCAEYLIRHEGKARVDEYLTAMTEIFPDAATQAIYRMALLVGETA